MEGITGYIVHASNSAAFTDFMHRINTGLITGYDIEGTKQTGPRMVTGQGFVYYFGLCQKCGRHIVLQTKPFNYKTLFNDWFLCNDCLKTLK